MTSIPKETIISRRSPAGIAALMLTLCCVLWGFSFPAMQFALHSVERSVKAVFDESGPSRVVMNMTFNGWRFTTAALIYGLITFASQRRYRSPEVRGGMILGLLFIVGMTAQLTALRYVRPSVSSFLTSLGVIFAPLAQAFILHKSVRGRVWLAVVIAMIGTLILSMPNDSAAGANSLTIAPPMRYLGEMLTVAGSLIFTTQLMTLDHYGTEVNTERITFVMLMTAGLFSLAASFIVGGGALWRADILGPIFTDFTFQWSFGGMVLMSTVIALHLMNKYQPYITPSVAVIIYSLESPFATVYSALFQTETLTTLTLIGGSIILGAVLLVTKK